MDPSANDRLVASTSARVALGQRLGALRQALAARDRRVGRRSVLKWVGALGGAEGVGGAAVLHPRSVLGSRERRRQSGRRGEREHPRAGTHRGRLTTGLLFS